MAELGGRVYAASKRVKNPLLDAKVKATLARIDKLEKKVALAAKQAAPRPKSKKAVRKPAPRPR